MLMKPKRWLAYTIELNDLLPHYEGILSAFDGSDVPLDATFGSNSESGMEIPGILVAVGSAVEPARLAEVLALLDGIDRIFLTVHDAAVHSKVIYVGALNLDGDPIAPFSDQLSSFVRDPNATPRELMRAIERAPKIDILSERPRRP